MHGSRKLYKLLISRHHRILANDRTTPAKTMSQAMATLTATAARNGQPIATMPKMISKTPHTIDNVEACRTMSAGLCCATETS